MRNVLAVIAVLFVLLGVAMLWVREEPAAPTPQPLPGDGIQFGFVRGIQTENGYVIVFDAAQWLTGTEGENAAIAAGQCTEATRGECLPSGFYIENTSTSTIPLQLASEPIIAMYTLNMEEVGVTETQISKEEYAALVQDTSAHWSSLPYQMLIEQGEVTIIEEVYVP